MKMLITVVSMIFTAGVLAMPAMAGEDDGEKSRDCLPMSRIDRVEVVDDRTLIFHMHGDKKYVNNLPYRCSGLRNNAFIHETSLNQYCDLDTITVYDTSIGMRLGSCPLGEFEPYVEMEETGGEEE